MKRRDVLRYTALITGAAISAPLALSLSSCKPDGSAALNYTPEFFSLEQFEFIQQLVDIIIPKSDSPSATDVGVHQTIDEMVGKVYEKANQEDYMTNFEALYIHLLKDGKLSAEKVQSLEERSTGLVKTGYQALKQQTIAYYLSTEEVGTKFLNYLPMPGEYEGCIDLADVGGKAWAL
jgi:hypothetical protein